MGRLLLKTVLSDPYVDVALVGVREPRFVELNNDADLRSLAIYGIILHQLNVYR